LNLSPALRVPSPNRQDELASRNRMYRASG
jgi:hypothetical protein